MLFNKEVENVSNGYIIIFALFRYERKTMRGPLHPATFKQVIESAPSDGVQTTLD